MLCCDAVAVGGVVVIRLGLGPSQGGLGLGLGLGPSCGLKWLNSEQLARTDCKICTQP